MSERAARRGLLIVLALYLLLGGVYSYVAPLGEAPDEMEQFQYMRYIVEQRRLPRTAEERLQGGIKSEEPPLYYALLGLATSWVDVPPASHLRMLDPERYPRHALPDEVLINFSLLHTADEHWPFRGLVLVWHLARLCSLGLAAATLAVLFHVVRRVSPGEPAVALLATIAAALTPQFVYVGSSLQNDLLAGLLGALLLWPLMHLAEGDVRWRQFLLVGLVLGLGRLTKFYMLALLPAVVVILAALACRKRGARYLAGLAVALLVSFLVPLPWLLYVQPIDPSFMRGLGRVLVLFDVVHMERWFGSRGVGQVGTGLPAIAHALTGIPRLHPDLWAQNLFRSYWGYFGAMTVLAPWPVYALAVALSGASLAGWLRILSHHLRRQPTALAGYGHLWIPAVQVLALLGTEALFFGTMKRVQDTSQARHLYPALTGLALFLAIGWRGLWQRLASSAAAAGLSVLLVGLSVYCLPTVLSTASKPFLPVRATSWPDAPAMVETLELGDGLQLLGTRWAAGDPGRLTGTLYWHASAAPTSESIAVLELLDPSGEVEAVWAGHPGGARYPTQAWSAGDYVRQQVAWPLPQPLPAGPHTLRLRLLREGAEEASHAVGSVALLAAEAAPVSADEAPSCLVYGEDGQTALLRDTVLVTLSAGHLQGLVGPDGALWKPVAQTTDGRQAALVVDARVRPGQYVATTDGTQPADVPATTITVAGRERLFEPPPGLQPVGAVLGGSVELVGYELENGSTARVAPGQVLHLRLVWRAERRVEQHYTVFTHLVDGQGVLWGQQDKLPGQEYSTLFWAPGEVIVDDYALDVSPDAPAGVYHIRAGLYQALSGARAPVVAEGRSALDYVLLGEVEVVQE